MKEGSNDGLAGAIALSPDVENSSVNTNTSITPYSVEQTGSDERLPLETDEFHQKTINEEVYMVQQRWGYVTIGFIVMQTITLIVMISYCNVAPLEINPMLGPYPDTLDLFGAKNSVLIVDQDQWVRFLSPMVLHSGLFHLICNVAVQIETCHFFEREWGSPVFFVIYYTGGVGSALLSACVLPNTLSVGASGAVMAILGAKCSEFLCKSKNFSSGECVGHIGGRRETEGPIKYCKFKRGKVFGRKRGMGEEDGGLEMGLVGEETEEDDEGMARNKTQESISHGVRKQQFKGVIFHLILVSLCSFIPYIDWTMHLGGFITGVLVGLIIFSYAMHSKWLSLLYGLTGTVLLGMYCVVGWRYLYSTAVATLGSLDMEQEEIMLSDVCGYYEEQWEGYQCSCPKE